MYRRSAFNAWKNLGICHFGKERSSSNYCDSLLFTSTSIGVKNSTLKFTRDIADFCKFVNFIRTQALNHRIIKEHCQEMGAQREVLYHTEVRWLSKGQAFFYQKVFLYFSL